MVRGMSRFLASGVDSSPSPSRENPVKRGRFLEIILPRGDGGVGGGGWGWGLEREKQTRVYLEGLTEELEETLVQCNEVFIMFPLMLVIIEFLGLNRP